MRHNWLRDVIIDLCHSARSRLTPQTRPVDVLVVDWERGRPAAWDVTVASPLTPALLNEAGMTAGAAAAASEQRKHIANDPKCQELGWVCVPLAVETYGNWGTPLLPVWPLGLPSVSVFLCRKVRSLLILLADLVWC